MIRFGRSGSDKLSALDVNSGGTPPLSHLTSVASAIARSNSIHSRGQVQSQRPDLSPARCARQDVAQRPPCAREIDAVRIHEPANLCAVCDPECHFLLSLRRLICSRQQPMTNGSGYNFNREGAGERADSHFHRSLPGWLHRRRRVSGFETTGRPNSTLCGRIRNRRRGTG